MRFFGVYIVNSRFDSFPPGALMTASLTDLGYHPPSLESIPDWKLDPFDVLGVGASATVPCAFDGFFVCCQLFFIPSKPCHDFFYQTSSTVCCFLFVWIFSLYLFCRCITSMRPPVCLVEAMRRHALSSISGASCSRWHQRSRRHPLPPGQLMLSIHYSPRSTS